MLRTNHSGMSSPGPRPVCRRPSQGDDTTIGVACRLCPPSFPTDLQAGPSLSGRLLTVFPRWTFPGIEAWRIEEHDGAWPPASPRPAHRRRHRWIRSSAGYGGIYERLPWERPASPVRNSPVFSIGWSGQSGWPATRPICRIVVSVRPMVPARTGPRGNADVRVASSAIGGRAVLGVADARAGEGRAAGPAGSGHGSG